MVQPWTGRGWETPPPQRGARSTKAPHQADIPSAPATRWAKMRLEEKRESAPEETMEEEECAPGQVVRKLGGQDGSWLFLFPLFGCVLFFVFFVGARRRLYYDRSGRSGSRKTGI